MNEPFQPAEPFRALTIADFPLRELAGGVEPLVQKRDASLAMTRSLKNDKEGATHDLPRRTL
jgi:hypothetical protein